MKAMAVGRACASSRSATTCSGVCHMVAVKSTTAGLERLRAGHARGRIVVDVEGGF